MRNVARGTGGAPTKRTQAVVDQILAALEDGDTHRAAAAAGGISKVTFYRWIEADETFRAQVEKAEGIAEHRYRAVVRKAADEGNWQAGAWWLERRRYEDYARRERVDMTVDIAGEVRKLAAERGLDESVVMAEAEAILSGKR